MRDCHRLAVAWVMAVGLASGIAPPALADQPRRPAARPAQQAPHPAVVRIIVPEPGATSFGSGTLVDVRDQFGLVVTNWHVVRDGQGDVEVVFPDGFRSKARPLKVDADWDLAALVIWRPEATPVPIAPRAPRPGERLTICGYGQGQYRAVTGRCTQYYAPRVDLPQHMVELDVEARQGDSGGPIFNEQGELAGVLFGAGGGTTMGSFGGQVEWFLATLAPDIGRPRSHAMAATGDASPLAADLASGLSGPPQGLPANAHSPHAATPSATAQAAADEGVSAYSVPADGRGVASDDGLWSSAPAVLPTAVQQPTGVRGGLVQLQTMLAAIGALALAAQVLRAAR